MSSISPSKRRLLGDLRLLKQKPEDYFDAVVDNDNMYVWYFLLTNFKDCDYEGGYYLGKIILDEGYPFKAGNIQMLTPSGRFLINKNICVTATAYHQSEYNPTWNIKSLIIGFHSIMMSDDKDNYGVSHIRLSDTSSEARREYARNSIEYNRNSYINIFKMFGRFIGEDGYPLKEVIMPTTETVTPVQNVEAPNQNVAVPIPVPVPNIEVAIPEAMPNIEANVPVEIPIAIEPFPDIVIPVVTAPKKRAYVRKEKPVTDAKNNPNTKPKRTKKAVTKKVETVN